MERFFNIAGPCIESRHYMMQPSDRIPGVERLVAREQYFVIHAPRQSGKTTFVQTLANSINQEGSRYAAYVSLERTDGCLEFETSIRVILTAIIDGLNRMPGVDVPRSTADKYTDHNSAVLHLIQDTCRRLDRPLVLLIDEADCLTHEAMRSFLRQLREGYIARDSEPFPSSIALIGMRNIRELKLQIRPDEESLGTASPFNIAAKSLTIRNFTRDEIAELYQQHTEATGQVFEPSAIDRVFDYTHGQPWLVNAIAAQCVDELVTDTSQSITPEDVYDAREAIILERPTHLDSLMARLRERRVQRVIEPILSGDSVEVSKSSNDYLFTRDLGLVRDDAGRTVISNAIYREVIPRFLNAITQDNYDLPTSEPFLTDNQGLDMLDMLRKFQQFWRENSEIWIKRYDYKEAGPHLILQAYLQRIVNGGGNIHREYAAGTGRVDLCVEFGEHRYAVELKTVRQGRSREQIQEQGVTQLAAYLDRLGLNEGYLFIFDQREGQSWDDRIFEVELEHQEKCITILGA